MRDCLQATCCRSCLSSCTRSARAASDHYSPSLGGHRPTRCARQRCPHPRPRAQGTRLIAVVKANGYGHGAVPVARAALGAGATWLAVATLEEARELTGLAHVARILVMGGLVPDQAPAAAGSGFSIGVSSADFARALGGGDEVVPVHLKIDTGIGRFGSAPHE